MKLDKLGWVAAAGMAGAMVGMGLEPAAPKFATVDLSKVFSDSDYASAGTQQLQDYYRPRAAVMQFITENPAMLPADAQKYAKFSLETNRSAADDVELKRIETDAKSATSLQHDLNAKKPLTDDDQKEIADLAQRSVQTRQVMQELANQFDQETTAKRQDLHDKAMDQVRQAVKEVASKQGYSVVFSNETAPYAANDLTADALKIAKK